MSQSDIYSKSENGNQNEPPRQKHFMSFMFRGKPAPIPLQEERKVWPEYRVNVISYLFFWWMNGLLAVGYKRTVQSEDLYLLEESSKIDYMYQTFCTKLDIIVKKSKEKHVANQQNQPQTVANNSDSCDNEELEDFEIPAMALVKALFQTFWIDYSSAAAYKLFSDVASGLLPLLQRSLINFVEKKAYGLNVKMAKGVGYALGCSFIVLFNSVAFNHMFYRSMMTGTRVKAVLTKALLQKSFTVDGQGKHKFPVGKLNSMLATDLSRVEFCLPFVLFLLSFPVPMGIAIGLLIHNLGAPAVLGIGIFFVISALIMLGASIMIKFRVKANIFTDRRVNLIKELLKNFKIIKYYSWENSYQKNIEETRKKEIHYLFSMQASRNIIVSMSVIAPLLASMATFLLVHRVDANKNVGKVFSSVNLFQNLAMQFMFVPVGLATGVDALIGLRRVAGFLSNADFQAREANDIGELGALETRGLALKVVDASFEWTTYEIEEEETKSDKKKRKKQEKKEKKERKKNARLNTPVVTKSEVEKRPKDFKEEDDRKENDTFSGLSHLDFEINKGEFVVITGAIGSGKSSLLSALSGFMTKTEGEVVTNGSLLLCGYPWVQNATVLDNITFGSEYDEEKYNSIMSACSLVSDLDILPAGDRTEVGERGITLSGGQKARINLARAVYADRDIILMDDVLSAVDARVGKHIMEECILGILANKTRILATHQLSLIDQADRIIFLTGDGSVDIGTLDELKSKNEKFELLMSHSNKGKDELSGIDFDSNEFDEYKDASLIEKQFSKVDVHDDVNKNDGRLVQDEERAVNSITAEVYAKYIKAGSSSLGYPFLLIPLIIGTITTFCQLFTNTWLSFWTENKFPGRSQQFYSGLYVLFGVLAIFLIVTEFTLLAFFCNRAARTLNIRASQRLMHVPMSFIDTTPMGRILNRFTKDTEVLDNEIAEQIRTFVFPCFTIVGILILCIIYLPWFAIAIPFLVFLYTFFAAYYQATSREVKRLEAVTRSKVYAHFNESLGGMDTIKAYDAEDRFSDMFDTLIDDMNESSYLSVAIQRWISINLDILATVMTLIISFLCITRQFSISGASTGLVLSYVFTVAGQLSYMLRALTQIETELNSAERLVHYGYHLAQEAAYEIPERDPIASWPSEGRIKFENVSMSYRPELPYVLSNFSIDVEGKEKIGICGRTGAGKSSIMTAIYRLAEIGEGRMSIDGVDISTLGLHRLRSSLSIIPQDPVLFSGSIRDNLDPFKETSDDQLWSALRRAHLIEGEHLEHVKTKLKTDEDKHKFHLDQPVEDDGTNFSLGERQLIALARALVRESNILILDEATSSVDYETDSKIQKTIVDEFGECTILCIAHRLKTIVNYDKILVMDKGRAIEFDRPWNLFNDTQSEFRGMCDSSGITAEDFENR